MQFPADGNSPSGDILLFLFHRLFNGGRRDNFFFLEILIQSKHSLEIVQLCHSFIRLRIYSITRLLICSFLLLFISSLTQLLKYKITQLRICAFVILCKCNYNFAYRKQLFCISKKLFAIFATQTKGVKPFDLRGKLRDGRSCHEREARCPVPSRAPAAGKARSVVACFGLRP